MVRDARSKAQALVALVLALLFAAPVCQAREPADQFFNILVQRGWPQLALDYLDQMEKSELADKEFRQAIDLRRGQVYLQLASRASSSAGREENMARARASLTRVMQVGKETEAGASASQQMAALSVADARRATAIAGLSTTSSSEKSAKKKETRAAYKKAVTYFKQAETFYVAVLKKFPKGKTPKEEEKLRDERTALRLRLARARVGAARTAGDVAKTYPKSSKQFKAGLKKSAKELGQLFEKYVSFGIGLESHFYEGIAYQDLGNHKQAISCFGDLTILSGKSPSRRALIADAHRHQAESFFADKKSDRVLEKAAPWYEASSKEEKSSPKWLGLGYQVAQAYEMKVKSLKKKKPAERSRLNESARKIYQTIARRPGEFQLPASKAFAKLGGRAKAISLAPKNFADALQASQQALADMNAAKLAAQVSGSNDPSSNESVVASRAEAIEALHHAMRLADDKTAIKDLNEARYLLAQSRWESNEYFQAALLGEFLARKYPSHRRSRRAAQIAMAAYLRLYQAALSGGGSADSTKTEVAKFESDHLYELAKYITVRWPGSDDASKAMTILIKFAIQNNRLNEARDVMAEVPAGLRGELELQLANALWVKYLRQSRVKDDSPQALAELAKWQSESLELFTSGFAAIRKSSGGKPNRVTKDMAIAALYLAQAKLANAEGAEALKVLEDKHLGPIPLLKKKHAATARKGYAAEVYKAALRAYVSVSPPQAEKAVAMMAELEKTVGKKGAKQLTAVYMSLGQQLQQQIEQLRNAGKLSEAQTVVKSFTEFLNRLSEMDNSASWTTSLWIAQTYSRLAEGLGQSPQADEFYEKSYASLLKLQQFAEKHPEQLPSKNSLLALKVEMGNVLRKMGRSQDAINMFSAVLREKEMMLSVQVLAAYTYQEWGIDSDPRRFKNAIFGGLKLRSTGKNRIWGWVKLGQISYKASRSAKTEALKIKYRDILFEARLNAARARFLASKAEPSSKRKAGFAKARAGVRAFFRSFPDYGGSVWRNEFDQLMKEIQHEEGATEQGIAEFASK